MRSVAGVAGRPDGEPIEIAYHGDSISVFYAERAINKAGQELKL